VIYAQLIAGFIYLLGGGDLLVRGAVALARRLQVPSVFVALFIVGLGTSLPELVVSVRAATTGFPGLALGNVVGSNIANVLVVAGVAAIVYPAPHR
jgi:cation:H+ antiporter